MKHVLTGPSSALTGDNIHISNSCNAVIHGMMTVEAENIAYAAIQVSHYVAHDSLIYLSSMIGSLSNHFL
jgi:hypothetical protein